MNLYKKKFYLIYIYGNMDMDIHMDMDMVIYNIILI